MARPDPLVVAREVWHQEFQDARAVFLAGSVIRGESTPHSDLDMVVVYAALSSAWRESLVLDGWPVEAFVHDPATLRYFFELDARGGRPALAQMVTEAVCITPPDDFSHALRATAQASLAAGPPPLSILERDERRYAISDLIDDLRSPRSHAEAVASAVSLYPRLADFWFRSHGRWSASGKTIPRLLARTDADLAQRFERSFQRVFSSGETRELVALSESILAPFGGYLFAGHKRAAPADWRKPLPDET